MQINPPQSNFPPNSRRHQTVDSNGVVEDEKPGLVQNRGSEYRNRLPKMTDRNWDQGKKADVGEFEGGVFFKLTDRNWDQDIKGRCW